MYSQNPKAAKNGRMNFDKFLMGETVCQKLNYFCIFADVLAVRQVPPGYNGKIFNNIELSGRLTELNEKWRFTPFLYCAELVLSL